MADEALQQFTVTMTVTVHGVIATSEASALALVDTAFDDGLLEHAGFDSWEYTEADVIPHIAAATVPCDECGKPIGIVGPDLSENGHICGECALRISLGVPHNDGAPD